MVELVEVSHDPFASSVKLTPIDHDPFTAMAADQAPQPAAESGFRKVLSGMGEGLREQAATPGAIMQQNPYPAGSEEASWFEDQRASTAANWAPGMAMSMMGAGTPFAKPGVLGAAGGRLSASSKMPIDEVLSKYIQAHAEGKLTDQEFEGFVDALRERSRAEQKSPEENYDTTAYRGVRVVPGRKLETVHQGTQMYSSSSPEIASMYSGIDPRGSYEAGASVIPLKLNIRDYHVVDLRGKIYGGEMADAIKQAKQSGKKGVVIKNVHDEPLSQKMLPEPHTVYVTFPEGLSTAKSKFASEFNPLSPDISKMLLAAAGTGAVIHVMNPSESKAAQPDHDWLNAYPEKK